MTEAGLVPKEQYYRPTLARGLRGRATRVEVRLMRGIYLGLGGAFLACLGVSATCGSGLPMLVMLPLELLVLGIAAAVLRGATQLRAEAAALEAEHAARYGALPPGEAP